KAKEKNDKQKVLGQQITALNEKIAKGGNSKCLIIISSGLYTCSSRRCPAHLALCPLLSDATIHSLFYGFLCSLVVIGSVGCVSIEYIGHSTLSSDNKR